MDIAKSAFEIAKKSVLVSLILTVGTLVTLMLGYVPNDQKHYWTFAFFLFLALTATGSLDMLSRIFQSLIGQKLAKRRVRKAIESLDQSEISFLRGMNESRIFDGVTMLNSITNTLLIAKNLKQKGILADYTTKVARNGLRSVSCNLTEVAFILFKEPKLRALLDPFARVGNRQAVD